MRTGLLASSAALAVGAIGVSSGLLPSPDGSGGISYHDNGPGQIQAAGIPNSSSPQDLGIVPADRPSEAGQPWRRACDTAQIDAALRSPDQRDARGADPHTHPHGPHHRPGHAADLGPPVGGADHSMRPPPPPWRTAPRAPPRPRSSPW